MSVLSNTYSWLKKTYNCYKLSDLHERAKSSEGSDKVFLPDEILHIILSNIETKIEYPYVFILRNRKSKVKNEQYCGVLEFQSSKNIYLPTWMMRNLQISSNGGTLEIELVKKLNKGTLCKLQPHKMEFIDQAQLVGTRVLLETLLSKYTVLSLNETISLTVDHKQYLLNVTNLEPSQVCIIQDIELAISFDEPLDAPLKVKDKSNHTNLVSFDDNLNTNKNDDKELSKNPNESKIMNKFEKIKSENLFAGEGHTLENEDSNGHKCPLCLSVIPIQNKDMHMVRCQRNTKYHRKMCPKCKNPILLDEYNDHCHCDDCQFYGNSKEVSEHYRKCHEFVRCKCGKSFTQDRLNIHRSKECVYRLEKCEFCHLNVPHNEITQHNGECGSKTTECDKCHKLIVRNRMSDHLGIGCERDNQINEDEKKYRNRLAEMESTNRNAERINELFKHVLPRHGLADERSRYVSLDDNFQYIDDSIIEEQDPELQAVIQMSLQTDSKSKLSTRRKVSTKYIDSRKDGGVSNHSSVDSTKKLVRKIQRTTSASSNTKTGNISNTNVHTNPINYNTNNNYHTNINISNGGINRLTDSKVTRKVPIALPTKPRPVAPTSSTKLSNHSIINPTPSSAHKIPPQKTPIKGPIPHSPAANPISTRVNNVHPSIKESKTPKKSVDKEKKFKSS